MRSREKETERMIKMRKEKGIGHILEVKGKEEADKGFIS